LALIFYVALSMKWTKKIRKRLEVVLFRLGVVLVPKWPRRWVVAIAHGVGWLAYRLPTRLKRIGLANLDVAFGDTKTRAEKNAILLESCQTVVLSVLDIFWFSADPHDRVPRHVTFDPSLKEVFQKKKQVCITAHMGNWELLGHAVSVSGFPLSSVAAPLVNPAVDELFEKLRVSSGQIIISQQGAIRALIKTLRDDGKAAMLLDQNLDPKYGGVFMDFFGKPVPVSDAPASLAIRTGAEILFGFCLPDRKGDYTVVTRPKIIPPVLDDTSDKAAVYHALTRQILAVIEDVIREHPGAWVWMYKRWKFIPEDCDGAGYPFYGVRSKK